MENSLIIEINDIRKKMGLSPYIIEEKNTTLKSRLLLEDTREDVIRGFLKSIGIDIFTKTIDDVRLSSVLQQNPVTVRVVREGGNGLEDIVCRSIDELIVAAETQMRRSGAKTLEDAISAAVGNNPNLKLDFGTSLCRGDLNKTIDSYLDARANVRSQVTVPTNTRTKVEKAKAEVSTQLNKTLDEVDKIFGKGPVDPQKDVTIDDFKSSQSGDDYEFTRSIAPDSNSSADAYFTLMSTKIQQKIDAVKGIQSSSIKYFNDLRSYVKNKNLPTAEADSITKEIDKAQQEFNVKLNESIKNLENNKAYADAMAKAKGESATDWLRNGLKSDTQTKTYNFIRGASAVFSWPNQITASLLSTINKEWLPRWQGLRKAISKSYEPNPNAVGNLQKLANRYDAIMQTTISVIEDTVRYFQISGVNPKQWLIDLGKTIFKGESSVKFSYEEASQRAKGIMEEMLKLSQQLKQNDRQARVGVGDANPGRGINRFEYNLKMKALFAELQGTLRNTTKNRFYDEIVGDDIVQKLKKLEDLASDFNATLKGMSDADIPGATELNKWFDDFGKTEGDVSAIMQLCGWLDEAAESMKFHTGSKSGVTSFDVKDVIPIWDFIKNQVFSVLEFTGFRDIRPKDPDAFNKAYEASAGIIQTFRTKVMNLLSYGHFTNHDVIKRIFAVHGPIKGAFSFAIREAVMHTIVFGALELLKELVWVGELFVCSGTEGGGYCISNMLKLALEGAGNMFDNDMLKLKAAELNDRLKADWVQVMEEEIEQKLTNYQTYFLVPLFNDNSLFAKQALEALGWDVGKQNLYIENEITTFQDYFGSYFSQIIDIYRYLKEGGDSEKTMSDIEKLQKDWNKKYDDLIESGYIYKEATGSEVARALRTEKAEDIKSSVEISRSVGNPTLPESINNSTQVTLANGKKIGLEDGFYSILTYPDEPTGTYKFKNGETYDFSMDQNTGYSKHEEKAKDWFRENNFIGINDIVDQKFYRIYAKNSLSDAQLKNYYDNNKLNIINGEFVQMGERPYSVGKIYFSSPGDGEIWELALLDKVIPISRLEKLIKEDDKKRRVERAGLERREAEKNLEDTLGKDLYTLKKNLKTLNTSISDYENKDYEDEESLYFATYIRARMMRDGSKQMCNDPYYGPILKNKKTDEGYRWCKNDAYYDQIEGKYLIYSNLYELIKDAENKYSSEQNKIENNYDKQISESKILSKFSNIINEFIYKNKMFETMKRRLNRNYLIETKRFDEDDYKHWKDTFKFQAVDEKNPGRYKDVKINMEDVMDRINHFRKKYDEDDAFVRAVVDTHENVVRFMFTKELANIKEGYEPVGFAKILMQLKEGRGEMEIWSVSRPASGNWFLVKGDFTPKELLGMDLEKIEPSDKEPKKKENPLDSLKKKENDANEKLKNNEKDGLNELPKNVQLKLKQKFGRGWTTEEPNEVMKDFYTKTHVTSVFGDDIEIYRLNANDEFFDYLQSNSSQVELKRGFCRSLYLAKNKEGITPQQKRVISHIINVCNNKFNNNLGLTIREPKK